MKNQVYLVIGICFLLSSCENFKQKDDYQDLVKKIKINPRHELSPPIASNVFLQELEKPDRNGNNVKFIAKFEKGLIKAKYLALMLNDEKVILRDDGKGADEVEGDNNFSLNMKDNLDEIKSELSQRQKLGLSKERTFFFDNRSLQISGLDSLKKFNVEQIQKGRTTQIPKDIIRGVRGLSDQKKTLMITGLGVVEDTTRTFNPCTQLGNPNGVWTFGQLMRQMASPNPSSIATDLQVSNFVRNWLNTWSSNQTVNGELLPARNSIQNLITDWENKSSISAGGILDMKFAPFKLIAIVNRLDLRGNSGYGFSNAGEGRLVFNALDPGCNPMQFTVIFEYGINKRSCSSIKAFAQEWNNLNSLTIGSPAYNTVLENITAQFVLSGTNTSKPNQNSINQIRTNERAIGIPWELREFNLKSSGQLELVDVKQEPQVRFNGVHTGSSIPDVEEMVQWINTNVTSIENNNYTVPLNITGATPPSFRGGHSLFVNDNVNQIWNGRGSVGTQFIISDKARHIFSLNTCSSCHGGETRTVFTHISPSGFGVEATLSGFLTGITVMDPANRPLGSPASRTFNDLLRRENDLSDLISNTCLNRPFFELAHKLTFNPIRMTH